MREGPHQITATLNYLIFLARSFATRSCFLIILIFIHGFPPAAVALLAADYCLLILYASCANPNHMERSNDIIIEFS
uniref:Uncharacterized protein n=1 Tax=Kalanchoe fedtschenkoi TaxID=63787 RepID=A0A7N0REP1_KALFE